MGKDEDSQRLIDDPQFSEAEEAYKSLEEALTQLLSARETTIKNLKKLKEEVEQSYDLSRKSLIGGTAGQHSKVLPLLVESNTISIAATELIKQSSQAQYTIFSSIHRHSCWINTSNHWIRTKLLHIWTKFRIDSCWYCAICSRGYNVSWR